MISKQIRICMEDYFDPGFRVSPAVHIGSQTVDLFHGSEEYQAWEGFQLAGTHENDTFVARDLDEDYLCYWEKLVGRIRVVNISGKDKSLFLSEVILADEGILSEIRERVLLGVRLVVFLPTALEEGLARKLGIPLHGLPAITKKYGTKSGIRRLADEVGIEMPRGFVCSSIGEVDMAIQELGESFEEIVIKHDESVSGMFSRKLNFTKTRLKSFTKIRIAALLDEILGRKFLPEKDVFVVEGWVKSEVSIGAHIEISVGEEPILCAAWQQMIAADGISYVGAAPLLLSPKAMGTFVSLLQTLAMALKDRGAVGSFGPDFILTAAGSRNVAPNTFLLIELNTRAPMTAFPLEIVKQIRGTVGNGFFATHVSLPHSLSFTAVKKILSKEKLLITKKARHATGVVPYNVGLLPWRKFDVVAMADTWEETWEIAQRVKGLFV